MLDPYLATAMFALAAVVLGAVIFGGTTLAYFLGRRSDSPKHAPVQSLRGASSATATGETADATRDEAA